MLNPTNSPSVNFYRDHYYDEVNRQLVEACKRGDKDWIRAHLFIQDNHHQTLFDDELFENRIGMQLIQQLLFATNTPFDIADVACGNAMLLRRLREDGHRVQGVDISSVRVAKNNDISIKEGFCEALPLADKTFDIVIALECMEHVYDLDLSLRECARVLREGGVFICQVPLENFADGCNHVRLFTKDALRQAVTNIGLEVFNVWLIPYLVGQDSQNICLIARRPGNVSQAANLIWPILLAAANANQATATENK